MCVRDGVGWVGDGWGQRYANVLQVQFAQVDASGAAMPDGRVLQYQEDAGGAEVDAEDEEEAGLEGAAEPGRDSLDSVEDSEADLDADSDSDSDGDAPGEARAAPGGGGTVSRGVGGGGRGGTPVTERGAGAEGARRGRGGAGRGGGGRGGSGGSRRGGEVWGLADSGSGKSRRKRWEAEAYED